MTAVPFELPLKASEASALAELIFRVTEGRALTDEVRSRIAARAAPLGLKSLEPYWGSLEADPVHSSTYYIAADACGSASPCSLLLHLAPASAPASSVFENPLLIGRMRPDGGREVVVNAIPFSSHDHDNIRKFAERINRAFFPRPQGALPAIAAGNRHPEISLPAVFDAYRIILKNFSVNMASTAQLSATREMTADTAIAARDGENPTAAGHTRVSIRHLYHAGVWAAIRSGWREGYNAEADHFIITGETDEDVRRSIDATKTAIREASGYTKFTTDTSRLFRLQADPRHPQAWSDRQVEQKFERIFTSEERGWLIDEFSRGFEIGGATYSFSFGDIARLAVKFGESLKINEELFDEIRAVKAASPGRTFDFEPSLDEAETLTTPKELIFYMHWLKQRGRAAQLVPPNLGFKKRQAYPEAMKTSAESGVGLADYAKHKMWPELLPRVEGEFRGRPLEELGARVSELAAVARHFNGTLSIHSGSGKQAEVLEQIGRATSGRVNYKISGELQLQLFDVLREQSHESPWRRLYDRMVARCDAFAAAGAFGEESELAMRYREMGRGSSLGDCRRGRVDGNLFLVFWLGNVVGSRDIHSPDGDHRFFKEKLDELPSNLVRSVRERNTDYVVWLASHLRG